MNIQDTKPENANNIVFYNTLGEAPVEVLRITRTGITANPDVPVDEAAAAVIRALNGWLTTLTRPKWVWLTYEEQEEIVANSHSIRDCVTKTTAKLKEKNA